MAVMFSYLLGSVREERHEVRQTGTRSGTPPQPTSGSGLRAGVFFSRLSRVFLISVISGGRRGDRHIWGGTAGKALTSLAVSSLSEAASGVGGSQLERCVCSVCMCMCSYVFALVYANM